MASGPFAHSLTNARLGAMFHRQVIEKTAEVFGEVGVRGRTGARGRTRDTWPPGRQGSRGPEDNGAQRRGMAAAGDHQIEDFQQ